MNISVFDSITVSAVFTSTISNKRYWVGGTAAWDGTAGTKWSETSGGAGGASVPTLSDDVFLDANSGSSTITVITINPTCRNFDCTGFTGTLAGSIQFNCYGNVTLGSGMTITMTSGLDLRGNTWAKTFTSNGVYMAGAVWLNQSATAINMSTWTFVNFLSTATLSNFGGSLDISGNITVKSFGTFASDARTINMGSGLWTITGGGGLDEFRLTTVTGLTWNKQTANIKFTAATGSTTFIGGGKSFNQVWFDRGTNSSDILLSIGGTFSELKDTGTVAHSIKFTAGTTWTFDDFTVSGSAGNVISINSATTGTHTLVNTGNGSSPFISRNYLNIQHSIATGSPWYAGLNSVNNQGVATTGSGWIFDTATILSSESISVSENIDIFIKIPIEIVDSISISESISLFIPSIYINIFDSISVLENIQIGISDISKLIFDSISVSENILLFIPSLKISTFDAISISENILLKIQILFISVSEVVAVSEFLNISEITAISATDSISVIDNVQIKIAYLLLSSIETITISELPVVNVPYVPIIIFDIISLSDASHFSAIDKYGYDVEEYRPMGSIVFTRGYMEE